MANLTSVTLTSGVPTAGTGTVGTIDNVTGTAGSPSTAVLTVQGVASGTPQPVSIGTTGVVSITSSQLGSLGQQTTANSVSVTSSTDSPLRIVQDVNSLYAGNTTLTPISIGITDSSSGASTLVALVTSKKIRVLAMALTVNGAVNVKLQSHTTTATATGLFYCAAAGDGFVLPYNPVGWFDTASGEALDLNLSGAVAVGGTLTYVSV